MNIKREYEFRQAMIEADGYYDGEDFDECDAIQVLKQVYNIAKC